MYLLGGGVAICADCGTPLICQTQLKPGKPEIQQYRCPARRRGFVCGSRRRLTAAWFIDPQVGVLLGRLRLPDDWRQRLDELAEHQEERANVEGKRRYLEDRLRRLRELYLDGDFTKGEYNRRRAKLQADLSALAMPAPSAIESAGETLETLGEVWADTLKRLQAKMLKTIFEEVVVDVAGRRLVSVKPWPPFWPLSAS